MTAAPHPQLATSASIFRDGHVLLVRRARAPARGVYTLPGGRVEFGETLAIALKREIMEETGLTIDIVALSGFREMLPAATGGGHYLIMSFAARWLAGEPVLNDELDDFLWVPPDNLGDRPMTDGLPQIISGAARLLGY